jgi:4-hydroxyisophthalate hydroxylase
MQKHHQVIIVGGGPVGVALAVELGLRGISCALIERRRRLQNIPKGQNLTQRTLEHFYFWGVVDALRAARVMPPTYPIGNVTTYKTLMSPYWHARPGREQVRRYYFQDNERLPQYCTEAVLLNKMVSLPSVVSRLGWSAKQIEHDADGVRVTIAEDDGPGHETLTADYVVGCDGGHSTVREQVGIARGGQDFDQLMVLAVFRSRELHEALKRFPERSTYRVMHPDLKGYWQFFGRIDVGEGFFFHAPVPAHARDDNFDFRGFLAGIAGFPFACEFDYVGFWDMRIAVAEKYQVGRAFIAGDAAHSHPPYGGYGLNNGLEDARNLGWKLAARLQGWGGDKLLASYSLERNQIFKETAEDFIAARINTEAEFLARYNPDRDRAEFERAWQDFDDFGSSRVMTYEPNYEGSPVVLGPPGGVSSAHGQHSLKARAGHHLTPQQLSSGRNVFEEFGSAFTLIALDAEAASVAAIEAAASRQKVPLKTIRDSFGGGRESYEARLILVRPDQYVVWTGDRVAGDAEALMERVTGRG